jgi:hypothetical protein
MLLMMAMSVVAARAVAAEQAAASRDQLFAMRCAKCHTVEKLTPGLSRRSSEARSAFLERFLSRHYAPDPAERKAIIELLNHAAQKK